MDVTVRWWVELDTPEVLEIEELTYGDKALSEKELKAFLALRDHIGIVADYHNRVVGFAIYRLGKYNLELIALAVSPAYRRQGVATAIIDNMKSKLRKNQTRRFLVVEVKESNVQALNFFKKNKFTAFKVVKNDYFDCDDDGIYMKWDKIPVETPVLEEVSL